MKIYQTKRMDNQPNRHLIDHTSVMYISTILK